MMCSDKISVVIPVYKVEKFIRKCLKSIVDQTYSNLEIIVVDDGWRTTANREKSQRI